MSTIVGNPFKAEIPSVQLDQVVAGQLVAKGIGAVSNTPLALPQTATANLFTVQGGAVLITSLVGIVTTAFGATATNLSLGTAPTVGTANTAGIGGPSAITSLVAGTAIAMPAAAGSAGSSLAAPAVPASGTPVTNNYHGTVDVTLAGFTLTAVIVNGVQVGTTNATYQVPAHGTISITYTVAGTWTWFGSAALEISAGNGLYIPKDVGFIVSAGFITWTTTASNTGAIKWYLNYIPLDGTVYGAKGPRVT